MTMHSGLAARMRAMWIPEPNTGCWIWIERVDHDGYGRISVSNRDRRAHRISFELANGPIPRGLHVCHRCDTPSCVNPDHLFLGTDRDNLHDMAAKGRHWQQRKTECPKGHPYTQRNTYWNDGHRYCRQCRREKNAARKSAARQRRCAA